MFKLELPDVANPVFGRRGTSDPWMIEHVLICELYRIPLPFEARRIIDAGANIGAASNDTIKINFLFIIFPPPIARFVNIDKV